MANLSKIIKKQTDSYVRSQFISHHQLGRVMRVNAHFDDFLVSEIRRFEREKVALALQNHQT